MYAENDNNTNQEDYLSFESLEIEEKPKSLLEMIGSRHPCATANNLSSLTPGDIETEQEQILHIIHDCDQEPMIIDNEHIWEHWNNVKPQK